MKKLKTVAGTAHDPTVKYSDLTLDNETYKLVFDFNAIAEVEAMTGINLLVSLDFQNLNALRYRALLFAAMRKAQPKITLEEVGNLIRLDAMPAITDALLEAWGRSIKTEEKPENPPEPEAPSPAE